MAVHGDLTDLDHFVKERLEPDAREWAELNADEDDSTER